MQLFIQKISIAIFNKNIHNQNDAQKSGQLRYIKKLSIALVQTKVINCNFANKVVSCNLCTQKLSQLRRNLAIFFIGYLLLIIRCFYFLSFILGVVTAKLIFWRLYAICFLLWVEFACCWNELFLSSGRSFASVRASRSHFVCLSVFLWNIPRMAWWI